MRKQYANCSRKHKARAWEIPHLQNMANRSPNSELGWKFCLEVKSTTQTACFHEILAKDMVNPIRNLK